MTLFDHPSNHPPRSEPREPSPFRIRALADVLAGFGWPGRGTFEKLTKRQREVALAAAREALIRIGRED